MSSDSAFEVYVGLVVFVITRGGLEKAAYTLNIMHHLVSSRIFAFGHGPIPGWESPKVC